MPEPPTCNQEKTNVLGPLFLGAPVWACERWKGTLFTERAPRREWLSQYAAVFNSVEGNSTFYALPAEDTVRRWADSTPDGFRFALKFPRAITHDRRLRGADAETAAFVRCLEILFEADRLGPSFLQLPPDFAPAGQMHLEKFLNAFPRHLPVAVEVRHHDWYDQGVNESRLDAFLSGNQFAKVIFDSRALYSKPPSDEYEAASQTRKPQTPIRQTVTAKNPFLRFVGRNNVDEAVPWIEEWAPVVVQWLRDGLSPYVFTHAPDDYFAPEFADRFVNALRQLEPEVPPLPVTPAEEERRSREIQGTLF